MWFGCVVGLDQTDSSNAIRHWKSNMELAEMLSAKPICRLCGEETRNGIDIYSAGNNELDLCELINKYLPIQIKNDEKLPRIICPGCHIQLEATKSFMDLIIAGQLKLRHLYKQQRDKLYRQEKQRQQLEQALQTVNPSSKVDTYTIQSDETGEKFLIQIFSQGPLFPPDHELSLRNEGLDKPKRRRGRPPKAPAIEEKTPVVEEPAAVAETAEIDDGSKRKRRIKVPSRYSEAIQGKELDKVFKEEGVLDELSEEDEICETQSNLNVKRTEQIIGRVENEAGEVLGEPVVLSRFAGRKTRLKRRTVGSRMQSRKRRRFQCELCQKEFLHRGRFELHKKSHTVNYCCGSDDCDFVCDKQSLLEEHQTETGHSGVKATEELNEFGTVVLPVPSKPVENPEEIASESAAPTSIDTTVKDEQFVCDKCDNKTFSCKQNFEVHMKAVHAGLKPFSCEFCGLRFPYARSLRLHLLKHSFNKEDSGGKGLQFKCPTCSKAFRHPSSLQYHRDSSHANGRRFVCNKCDKAFRHRQLLKRHQIVHSEERPHQCRECESAFKTAANLIHHISTVHFNQRSHWCPQCGKAFAHQTALKLHLRWHAGVRPYQCDICQKSFSQKGNLAEHRRIHTGEKPYQCDKCTPVRSFTTSSQFRLHRKRHLEDRQHQCSYCHKAFLHKVTMRCHMRRHVQQHPFKCVVCDKTFPEAWALRKHERKHTGEKPYKCEQCGKKFADSSNLTKHKKAHQQEEGTSTNNNLKQMVYITYEKDDVIATYIEPEVPVFENNELTSELSETIQVQHLLDQNGIPITFTTPDGQEVEVVSSIEDQNTIQGLLPDGTLIPINIAAQDKNITEDETQVDTILEEQLLAANMELLSEDGSKSPNNIQFISEEETSNMCLVTTFNIEDTINPQYLSMP